MKRCITSLEPSKMRLIRQSRKMRSTAIGVSPRARERGLGFVPSTAADLQRLVDDLPGAHGVPLFRGRRLEPDVVAAAIGHASG